MLVEILKPFPFSRNGVTEEQAVVGTTENIPDDLVPGLRAEGLVRETKALAGAPENKSEAKAETKGDAAPESKPADDDKAKAEAGAEDENKSEAKPAGGKTGKS